MPDLSRRAVWRLKLRFGLMSARNFTQGYAWSPVQRFRCCNATTPSHSAACVMWSHSA